MGKSWTKAVLSLQFGLLGLILLLSLSCSSASGTDASAPAVSTGTPAVQSSTQIPLEATAEPATPTQTSTPVPVAVTGGVSSTAEEQGETSEPTPTMEATTESAPSIPNKGKLKYPNLGSRLNQLVTSMEEGQTTSVEAAAGASVHSGESVPVTIHLSGSVGDVVAYLEENGADLRNEGEDYIEAYVPVALLGPVSERPGVIRVREIVPPEPG